MSIIESMPELISSGKHLDPSPEHLGWLHDSSDIVDDVAALHARMATDGYLLLRGYLDRDLVMDARRVMTDRLAAEGWLDPQSDPIDAIMSPQKQLHFYAELSKGNEPLHRLLRHGRMMQFFDRFLGGPAMCFDFTWIRAVSPGLGTPPHCDVVYMGRGTHNLFTAWTPIGPADFNTGGLMILEGSHNNTRLRDTYGKLDVDTYCTNRPPESKSSKGAWSKTGGYLTRDINQLRRSIGGRWLTAEYQPGDLLLFSIFTVHASTDNRSNRVRLSTDTRYQLASDPKDERWMGEEPIAHGQAWKRGRIC